VRDLLIALYRISVLIYSARCYYRRQIVTNRTLMVVGQGLHRLQLVMLMLEYELRLSKGILGKNKLGKTPKWQRIMNDTVYRRYKKLIKSGDSARRPHARAHAQAYTERRVPIWRRDSVTGQLCVCVCYVVFGCSFLDSANITLPGEPSTRWNSGV